MCLSRSALQRANIFPHFTFRLYYFCSHTLPSLPLLYILHIVHVLLYRKTKVRRRTRLEGGGGRTEHTHSFIGRGQRAPIGPMVERWNGCGVCLFLFFYFFYNNIVSFGYSLMLWPQPEIFAGLAGTRQQAASTVACNCERYR